MRLWRNASPTQAEFLTFVAQGLETLMRAPNIAGKTAVGAVAAAAFLRGETAIDGRTFREVRAGLPPQPIALPLLGTPPIKFLLAVPAYKSEGATEAMDKFLGAWPHQARMVANGAVGLVYVKPNRWHGSDPKKWSRLIVYPDRGTLPKGLRLHGAWADEVVSAEIWFEALMRRMLGHQFMSYMTLTPGRMRDCRWIMKRFPVRLGVPVNGLVHLCAKARENQLLTSADRLKIVQAAQGNPYARAALNGDWVDTAGDSPFAAEDLERWADYVEAGERGSFVMIDDGAQWVADRNGLCEKFREPLAGEECWVISDASAGIKGTGASGKEHDPSGMWVVSWHRRALLARYNGYLKPHQLAELMIASGYYYNEAELIPEVNGEWGGALLTMLMSSGYARIYLEQKHDSATGQTLKVYGWHTTSKTRGLLTSALQQALSEDSIDVWSQDAIDSLRQVVIEPETERLIAGAGYHDEDLICGGIFAYLLQRRGRPDQGIDERPRSFAEAIYQQEGVAMDDEAEELALG